MTAPACYTVADICGLLRMSKKTFWRLRAAGRLPFLEELQPSLGPRAPRFRCGPVDAWTANVWRPSPARAHLAAVSDRRRKD